MVEKVRTRKAALERVIALGKELVGDKPVHLGVVHARDIESGKALLEEAKKHFNIKECGDDRPFHFTCHQLWTWHGWIGFISR